MKILHVITDLRTGGAEKLMVDLLPGLKNKGFNVELLLFDGTETPFLRDLELQGIQIKQLGKGGSVYSIGRLFKLIPYLRRYDVVHTHNTAPQLYAAIGSLFSKAVLYTTEHSTSNRRRKWKWYTLIDKWMYYRYHRVVCISKIAADNLRKYIGNPSSKILTINNGINVNRYASAKPSPVLENIAPGCRKILMVAAFRREKDQDTLIRSLKMLPDNFHLFLIGDGYRRSDLMALSNELTLSDRIHFMGIRTDVANLLHSADYIVMSSHFEGLSLSSVEGMCAGKPFLASDVDGLRDVVQGAGILFPHEDYKALAQEIVRLDNSPELYSSVASSCFKRAQLYDISKMIEGYSEIYIHQ